MNGKITVRVPYDEASRASCSCFIAAYRVHLSAVQRALVPVLHDELEQQYDRAAARHPTSTIAAFQRSLRATTQWDHTERERFAQQLEHRRIGGGTPADSGFGGADAALDAESAPHGHHHGADGDAARRLMRYPADLEQAFSAIAHILTYTNTGIADVVKRLRTPWPGFRIRHSLTPAKFAYKCLQEAARHFDGDPFQFARDVDAHVWVERRRSVYEQLRETCQAVLEDYAQTMIATLHVQLATAADNQQYAAATTAAAPLPPPPPPPPSSAVPLRSAYATPVPPPPTATEASWNVLNDADAYIQGQYALGGRLAPRHTPSPLAASQEDAATSQTKRSESKAADKSKSKPGSKRAEETGDKQKEAAAASDTEHSSSHRSVTVIMESSPEKKKNDAAKSDDKGDTQDDGDDEVPVRARPEPTSTKDVLTAANSEPSAGTADAAADK